MDSDTSLFLQFFGDSALARVLDFLLDSRGLFDYSKTEIAKGAQIGWTTLYTIWDRLERFGIVTPTRKYGKTRLYKLNDRSPIVQRLLQIEAELIELHAPKQKMAVTAK